MARTFKLDTAAGAVKQFAAALTVIEPPEGIRWRTKEEKLLWSQYTRARAADGWRDFDLMQMAKIVKLEVDIRRHQKRLDTEGVVIDSPRGPIEHPLFKVVMTLQRQQLSLVRSLGLNQTFQDARVMTRQAKAEEDAARLLKAKQPESLLAMPVH